MSTIGVCFKCGQPSHGRFMCPSCSEANKREVDEIISRNSAKYGLSSVPSESVPNLCHGTESAKPVKPLVAKPATLREYMIRQLDNLGMPETDAARAVALREAEDASLKGKWDNPASDYEEYVLYTIYLNVQRVAYQMTLDECPNAWYLPMLKGGLPE